MELPKQFAAASRRRREKLFQHRKLRERLPQRHQFARRRKAQGDAAGEPFEVQDALELLADLSANDSLLDEVRDGIKTALDGLTLNERPEKPGAQQARAHAGYSGVQRSDKRRRTACSRNFLGEDGGKQLQVAHGNGIEDQSVVLLVIADAVKMLQCFNAGGGRVFIRGARAVPARGVFAEIVNDGPGSSHRLRVLVQAKACEFRNAKLFAQDALRVAPLKNPVFQARFHAANAFKERSLRRLEKLLWPGKQRLPGTQQLQFVAKVVVGARAGKFRGLEFTSGKIDKSQANGRTRGMFCNRSKKAIFARVEKGDVRSGAWCNHTHHFAANQLLAWAGLLHLIADRDFEAAADQPRDVALRGVV